MATIGTAVTYLDLAKRMGPDNKIARVIEKMSKTNEILDDMQVRECNDGTSHKTTIRTGLPTVAYRKLNYGVPSSKSKTMQVQDTTGMLEAFSKVDKGLAELNGNTSEFRLSEDTAFIEAMNQTQATTLFYGDTDVNPERFLGLHARYSTKSGAENGENIILGGGAGADNTSIWLACWGENTLHGIYPKGSTAGLSHRDLGEESAVDENGGEYRVLKSQYKWDLGLTLRDWRYVVRICNIDVSDLDGESAANLIKLMIEATEIIPSLNMGTPVFYCNRKIRTALRNQILAKNNVNLSWETFAGKKVLAFDGIPVRRCDAILNTEEKIA